LFPDTEIDMAGKIVNRQTLHKNIHRDNATGSAQQVLLAGLGAMSIARSESGKIAEILADQAEGLVAEGRKIETRIRVGTARKIKQLKTAARSKTKLALNSISRFKRVFEARFTRTLNALGIPTGRQVRELTLHMEQLQSSLNQLKRARLIPFLPLDII
jgi:poly(hydroxyalkanoate) granule-associated protein